MQDRKRGVPWFQRDTKSEGTKARLDSDAEVVTQLVGRDERAFLSLYDRYSRTIFRFLMHMTGSLAMAEELTQEVFVAVLKAMRDGTIARFDSEKGTLEGYLLGIARNLARVEMRKSRHLISLDELLETPEWNRSLESGGVSNQAKEKSLAVLIERAELRALYRAILDLPTHYREVVILCSLQEKSYKEAAALLEITEGTVASRMNRAKALLAAKLQQPSRDKAGKSKA